ncbi:MAG: type 4a pilus biogenesis protein PilO [Dissulfuribacterales bacterium]
MKKIELPLNAIEPLIQKISDLTKVQRIAICVAVVVVVVGVFVYFLYMPKYKEIGQLKKDITRQEELLAKTKQNARQFAKYQKLMAEKQAEFNVVSRALPLKREIPSLLINISQYGKDAGLEFLLFKPEAEKKKNFYAEIPVQMNLSGTYHKLGVFFDKLASMNRIVNINRFDLKGNGSSLSILCVAETYRFIESSGEEPKGKKRKK